MSLEKIVRERARERAEAEAQHQLELERESRKEIRDILREGIEVEDFNTIMDELRNDGSGYLLTWHGIEYRLASERSLRAGTVAIWRKNGGWLRRIFNGADFLDWLAKN